MSKNCWKVLYEKNQAVTKIVLKISEKSILFCEAKSFANKLEKSNSLQLYIDLSAFKKMDKKIAET